jgi:hydroxymethylpyrimidine pyrophosphatase-like HAD family hydrolase
VEALERFCETGRKLLLVTGRELPDLMRVFPRFDLFDRIVAENGALLYCLPREEQSLGEAPPDVFVNALRERDIAPLSVGRVIVATSHPNEARIPMKRACSSRSATSG